MATLPLYIIRGGAVYLQADDARHLVLQVGGLYGALVRLHTSASMSSLTRSACIGKRVPP